MTEVGVLNMPVAMEMTNKHDFEVIVGTYEQFVLGFTFNSESKELNESFSTHSHQSSVRCVSATNKYLATGGNDECIQLYDMVSRKACGCLLQHTGTITSLEFTPEEHHLISTSSDGSIAIYRVGSWQLEKVWPAAHKGSEVSCIAIHPSSKLAISMGQNNTLRTWNLVKGRAAYTTNISSLGKYMDAVVWSTNGTYFAIAGDNKINVFKTDVAGIVSTVTCNTRISCFTFIEDDILCFGEEDGFTIGYSVPRDTEIWRVKTEESRVKCIAQVPSSRWLVTASSAGSITVWERPPEDDAELRRVAAINKDCRITCMAIRPSDSARAAS